jgi:iron complex transport system substrate-binding protein
MVFLLAGCMQESHREVIDRMGNRLVITGQMERVISTAPSNTEIIIDLGLADRLVAVDKYSAEIEGVPPGLPHVDFFYPDAELVLGLRPDLIIANGHNETGGGDEPFKLIRETGISVAYIPLTNSITSIYEDIEFIADVLGFPERGRELTARMKGEIAEITEAGRSFTEKPRVYFEISPAPSMATLGQRTYLNEMIELAGAENIFADEQGIFFPSAEAVISRNPDIIFTSVYDGNVPSGKQTMSPEKSETVRNIKLRPGFEHINAVRNYRVYIIDANSSSRPSARVLVALKQMSQRVQTE